MKITRDQKRKEKAVKQIIQEIIGCEIDAIMDGGYDDSIEQAVVECGIYKNDDDELDLERREEVVSMVLRQLRQAMKNLKPRRK